mgnify:CR=1 FL=1
MKKRISMFLLALLAALTLTVPAWAETQPGDALIYDTESLLTDGERQQLESLADQITWQYDCAVYVVTIYDYEQYADGVYEPPAPSTTTTTSASARTVTACCCS